jgi:hypothetical protein
MTTLAILNGDWEILFADETVGSGVTGMRMIRRAAGASATIYSTLALYSAVADAADEFTAMGFRNPMLPVTPNAFTMENKYFIPRSSTEWLKEGTISADWSYTATPDTVGNGVVSVQWSGGTGPVSGDIGRLITQGDSGDTGTLLDFETLPNGNTVVWIRPDDSTPTTGDVFDGTGTLIVSGGTMSATSSSNDVIGQTRYTAIQAIGSVPTATEVYVYQDRTKLTDWEGNFQWWATDPTVSLGIISVLIRTHYQAAGLTATDGIADSDLEVFSRQYTTLYDNFRLNVGAGGFSALPLASSPDINNTTGYTNTGTLSGVTGSPTVGNGVYVGGTWATATAKGVITATNGTTDFDFYLIGDLTVIGSTTAVTGYDFDTAADDGFSATTGTTANTSGGPTDSTSGEGGTVTITLGNTTADHDGNSNNEPYSATVNAQTNVPIAKVYERMKYVTRRGATTADLFGAGVNVPGESYRGLEALIYYDGQVGTMTEGDNLVTDPASQWTARLMADRTTTTPEGVNQRYITVTDQQTSLASLANDQVIDDESGDSVTVDTAGAGGAIQSIASIKASPFGTFTGSQIFGAQGILYTGIDVNPQDYILTDDIGTLRSPPNTVTYLVDNTAAGDRVLVARDTGTAGVINKDQFGGMTVTSVSATSITVGGTVDTQVPPSAWIRVVAIDEQEEHRYKYASRTTGVSGVFTLTAITPGTADAGTSDTALVDAAGNFVSEGVEIGMLIYVAGRTSTYEVVTVTDANNLVIKLLYGAGGFTTADTYTINETIQAYDTNDNLFDLIIDAEATTTSYSNTFVQSTTFGTVVNVRQGKIILPFTQNQQVTASGATVTVVRQPDTIAV